LHSHVAYYENGANDGTPTGTYGGHALKDGPTARKDNRKRDANLERMEPRWMPG
jgi:hypothetical protein